MKTIVLSAVSALALGVCAVSTPASALPAANPVGLSGQHDGVTPVRWHRRYWHHRRWHHRRGRGYSRRYAPSQAGNAKDPSRPIRQQNQGMTTGGPRY